jgi:hypothetical protein
LIYVTLKVGKGTQPSESIVSKASPHHGPALVVIYTSKVMAKLLFLIF